MGRVPTSVTIRDVARVAKVHPGTVSRALNAETRGLVNQETAERVMRAAQALGSRPNPIARGLKTNRSYTIGVLIPDITNPLFPPILRGIEDRLDDAGYTSLIVNTDNDAERQRSYLDALGEHVRFSASFTEAEGARVSSELLGAADDITAIVAANDRLAIGCYDTLEARGLPCPDDVSFVAFNDRPFVERLRPPLTSVRVPQREIGTEAANLLLQRLGDGSQIPREILLEPTLVVRGSTAPPPAKPASARRRAN